MTTQQIFGTDHLPMVDVRTPADLGYRKSPTRAERDGWRKPDHTRGSAR